MNEIKPVRIGLVSTWNEKDIGRNLEKMKKWVLRAKAEQCEILCFPEGFLTGYHTDPGGPFLERNDQNVFSAIGELAGESGIDLLFGFLENDGNRRFITQAFLCADGRRAFYKKTHLGEKESLLFDAGEELPVFVSSGGVRIGTVLCVENHFPEIAQTLSLRGAEILFAPHAVPGDPERRKAVWEIELRARSYDSRVYMAACNCLFQKMPGGGKQENDSANAGSTGGGLMITGPDGSIEAAHFGTEEAAHFGTEEAAVFGTEETAVFGTIDREMLSRYHRSGMPMRYRYYPSRRRPELYDLFREGGFLC